MSATERKQKELEERIESLVDSFINQMNIDIEKSDIKVEGGKDAELSVKVIVSPQLNDEEIGTYVTHLIGFFNNSEENDDIYANKYSQNIVTVHLTEKN